MTLLNEALNYESLQKYSQYDLKSVIDKIDLVDFLKITGVNWTYISILITENCRIYNSIATEE